MPRYDFRCPDCGIFEAVAGPHETTKRCACGARAERMAVYHGAGVIVRGRAIPPASDGQAVQEETGKILRKAGWTGERALEELRANRVTDSEGRVGIDTKKLTKTAEVPWR